MKTFLAVYIGSPESMSKWNNLSADEQKQRTHTGVAAWHAWAEKHKKHILDIGSPLGTTKSISSFGISDIKNSMTGYTLIQAETHDAAARLFIEHPHFSIFPGEAVEVMECLPIPGIDNH